MNRISIRKDYNGVSGRLLKDSQFSQKLKEIEEEKQKTVTVTSSKFDCTRTDNLSCDQIVTE